MSRIASSPHHETKTKSRTQSTNGHKIHTPKAYQKKGGSIFNKSNPMKKKKENP